MNEGIQIAKYFQGVFRIDHSNILQACVQVEGLDKDVLVYGRHDHNRAVNGDIVAVELYPESQWRTPSNSVLQDISEDDPRSTAKQEDGCSLVLPTGKVVSIIRRTWRRYHFPDV